MNPPLRLNDRIFPQDAAQMMGRLSAMNPPLRLNDRIFP
jgi:hypothetical protein